MNTAEKLKEIVRQKYGAIALRDNANGVEAGGGCGPFSCCGPAGTDADYNILMNDEYQAFDGYVADADLGLGCGLPTQFAQIKPGDTVVDLGSGAGNDCFVARAETGETGLVIGLDMTPAMIDRARQNASALGHSNVEFVYGDIEEMPLPDNRADVVVSNCVMNLVPDKERAFAETFRILKPGGRFSISDIVLVGTLPEGLQRDAELYAGCVSGAVQERAYLDIVAQAGFTNVQVRKRKEINLPTNLLLNHLTVDELATYQQSGWGIYSITVFAQKAGMNAAELESVGRAAVSITDSDGACCSSACCA